MPKTHSRFWYIFMFLVIQLVIILLLTQEVNQRRVSYIINIFQEPNSLLARKQTADSIAGEDVNTNFSHLTQAQSNEDERPSCPEMSPLLRGPLDVSFPPGLTVAEVQKNNPLVMSGGSYSPSDCKARHKSAIIIPFRKRDHHLKYLLHYLHPFLQRQQLQYAIYIINQAGETTFNRGKLMNVGFREAMMDASWDCLLFHDVDLIPENDRNIYVCNSNPKHSAVSVDKFNYKLLYPLLFGGVIALTPQQFIKLNGFPNRFWGWGGEDDDISTRVLLAGMNISRPSMMVGRYKMIKHSIDRGNDENPYRFKMLRDTKKYWKLDGINTVNYKLISVEYLPLYTNITVNIGTKAALNPSPDINTTFF